MILIHDMSDKQAALKIQMFCLKNDARPKMQVSMLTETVAYYFEDNYPEGLEGVIYQDDREI